VRKRADDLAIDASSPWKRSARLEGLRG